MDQTTSQRIAQINSAGSTQVGLVQDKGTEQVGAVGDKGTQQVGLVQAKGDEVLASIPSDYTTLSNEVNDVKSDLGQKYSNIVLRSNDIRDYLYKKDTYINSSGVETSFSGWNLYKIPCKGGDLICVWLHINLWI